MTRGKWIAVIAAEAIGLCCCAGAIALFLSGSFDVPAPAPTVIAQATAAPSPRRATATFAPTETAQPTFTLVLQPSIGSSPRPRPITVTPSRVLVTPPSNLYNVIIPTPTAPPRMNYPVEYLNTFVVVTYPVSGTTTTAVSKSLEANAIADPHEPNARFYARTDWYLSAHWFSKETSRGCEVDRANVSIALTMTLPALATQNVPRDLSDRWSVFTKKAIVHESGHVNLAQDGARALQRDIANFPSATNCDVIQTRLRDLFDKSFAAIDKANVQYDADTQHGVTQGAVFP